MLYEVAIIENPTENARKAGEKERLVLSPTAIIAKDDRGAAITAVVDAKERLEFDVDRIEVLVRPFVA